MDLYPRYAGYFAFWRDYYQFHIDHYDEMRDIRSVVTYYEDPTFVEWASTCDYITTNFTPIEHTVTFTPPEGLEGTTLLVTTVITALQDYHYQVYDATIGCYVTRFSYYDAGEAVVEQTQEVVLGDDNTFYVNYDLPDDLVGRWAFFAELSVVVTDPASGETYTIIYERPLYIVYNARLNDLDQQHPFIMSYWEDRVAYWDQWTLEEVFPQGTGAFDAEAYMAYIEERRAYLHSGIR